MGGDKSDPRNPTCNSGGHPDGSRRDGSDRLDRRLRHVAAIRRRSESRLLSPSDRLSWPHVLDARRNALTLCQRLRFVAARLSRPGVAPGAFGDVPGHHRLSCSKSSLLTLHEVVTHWIGLITSRRRLQRASQDDWEADRERDLEYEDDQRKHRETSNSRQGRLNSGQSDIASIGSITRFGANQVRPPNSCKANASTMRAIESTTSGASPPRTLTLLSSWLAQVWWWLLSWSSVQWWLSLVRSWSWSLVLSWWW